MRKELILMSTLLLALWLSWTGTGASEAAGLPMGTEPMAQTGTTGPMAGTWEFSFGTMTLTQNGPRVTGTYQWYGGVDSGRVQGTFIESLNQFQGLWISHRNFTSQGFLRLRLGADRSSFTGTFERGSLTLPWCGVRPGQALAPGCGFSGQWQLRFGSPPGVTGQATLVQTGPLVTGTYVTSEGLTGEIVDGLVVTPLATESRVTGTWRNAGGEQSRFDWRLNLTTGSAFQGRRDPGNSDWCGWRTGVAEPQPCGW